MNKFRVSFYGHDTLNEFVTVIKAFLKVSRYDECRISVNDEFSRISATEEFSMSNKDASFNSSFNKDVSFTKDVSFNASGNKDVSFNASFFSQSQSQPQSQIQPITNSPPDFPTKCHKVYFCTTYRYYILLLF